MHKRVWGGMRIASFIAAVIGSIFIVSGVRAITTSEDVTVTVPATTLTVSGRAAPFGFVTVEEFGLPVATTTAAPDGTFSTVITSSSGLHTYTYSYVDQSSRPSQKLQQTTSLQSQQNTNISIFLSPTIEVPQNEVRIGSIVQVRGYSLPNTLIKLLISGSTIIEETTTSTSGFYEFLIASESLGEGEFKAQVQAELAGELSDTSLLATFRVFSEQNPTAPDIVVSPQQLPPPVVIAPENNATIIGNEVLIRGTSVPLAQITIYEDGAPIGSIFADAAGQWAYTFTSQKKLATLTFNACLASRCSVFSENLTLHFIFSTECIVSLELEEYRFWDIDVGQKVTLKSKQKLNDGIITIDWGNGTFEKFSSDGNFDRFEITYQQAGNYNGKIAYAPADKESCEAVRYFSVLVNPQPANKDLMKVLWLFLLLLIVVWVYLALERKRETTNKSR